MIYDSARQEEILNGVLAVIIREIETLSSRQIIKDIDNKLITECAYMIASYFRFVGLRCKAPAFSEENEWRFHAESDAGDVEFVKFRVANSSLIPYVELPLVAKGLEIKKIVCGPTLNPSLSRHSVEMLARKNGFNDLEIEISGIPLSRY